MSSARWAQMAQFKVRGVLLCLRSSDSTCPPSCSEERFWLPVLGVSLSQEQGLGGPPAFLPGSHGPGLGDSGRALLVTRTRPRKVHSSGPAGQHTVRHRSPGQEGPG